MLLMPLEGCRDSTNGRKCCLWCIACPRRRIGVIASAPYLLEFMAARAEVYLAFLCEQPPTKETMTVLRQYCDRWPLFPSVAAAVGSAGLVACPRPTATEGLSALADCVRR